MKRPTTLRLDNGTAWPDPDAVAEAFSRLPEPASMWRDLNEPRTDAERQEFSDYCMVRSAVEAYAHLAEHPAGTESAVQALRSLRRAVAARDVHRLRGELSPVPGADVSPAAALKALVALPDGTVATPPPTPTRTPRVRPIGGQATEATPIRMTCACGSEAATVRGRGEQWPIRSDPARCRAPACRDARHTPEWAPPAPGRYVLRAGAQADARTWAQLEEGLTVTSATVDMDRYAVVGTIRHGAQELAATWDDGEWRRIAGWLRRV